MLVIYHILAGNSKATMSAAIQLMRQGINLVMAALRLITGDALDGAQPDMKSQGTQTDPEDLGVQGKNEKENDSILLNENPDRYKSGWHEPSGRRLWDGSDWEDD